MNQSNRIRAGQGLCFINNMTGMAQMKHTRRVKCNIGITISETEKCIIYLISMIYIYLKCNTKYIVS